MKSLIVLYYNQMKTRSIRVAAIQMESILGDVDANLDKAQWLVRKAFQQGAKLIVLPEFFTSGMAFHPAMLNAARPLDSEPANLLKRLASENEAIVGGSFIALRDGHAYNTFVLALPDGSVFFHDKDIPTMLENCYYTGGRDTGVIETQEARIGVALCWEFIRTGTAQRLLGKVDIVVGGSCWWDLPENLPSEKEPLREKNLSLLRQTPSTFARLLGVPVVHASHAGRFDGFVLTDDLSFGKPCRSRYLGEAQITDSQGKILARLSFEDGEGLITADVEIGQANPSETVPEGFWIPQLWPEVLRAWDRENKIGERYYRDHLASETV